MANEYNDVRSKSVADRDHLSQVLQASALHDQQRSIHQVHTYHDHRKPWITNASVQNGAAVMDDISGQLHPPAGRRRLVRHGLVL